MAKRKNFWQKLQGSLHKNANKADATAPLKPETPAPSREKLVFEHLEPRLLLSDTPIPLATFAPAGTLTINVHSGDLKVETVYSGGTPQIRVWDNTLGTSLGQVALTQNVKISINGLPGISDKVVVDLGYDDGAAGTNATSPFAVMVELDGGKDVPLLSDDTLTFNSSGPDFYNPTTLFLKSTDDIVFASSFVSTGKLNVDSQEAITANGVTLQASDMYLGVTKAVTDGVTLLDGFNLLGNASGAINLVGATLTAGDIGLIVNTSVNVSTTDSSYASNLIKVAFVQTNSDAQITLSGATNLNATAGKITLAANSTVTAKATTQPDANSTAADKDASVASAIVSSSAGVTVGGSSSLTASGAVNLTATNTVSVDTIADGTAGANANGAKGGTVAVTQLGGDTSVNVTDTAALAGSSVTAVSTAARTVHTSAKATAGGATQPAAGSPTQGQQQLASNNAQTGDGALNFGAAVAVTHVGGDTTARLAGGNVTSASAVTVSATSSTATVAGAAATTEADGSAATGSPGVGVAAALSFIDGTTRASLGDGAKITAPSVTFSASTTTDARFGAIATSGAGSTSGVAVAGSLALHVGVLSTEAVQEAGSTASSTGAVTFNATSNTHHQARALPKVDGATGKSTGIGASVAINVVDETTRAQANANATFTGTSLTQNASATGDVDTEAKGGASGGTAVAPVVAITVVNTDAKVGALSGSDITLTGGLTSDAKSAIDVLAKGHGDAVGSDSAAVGASVVVTHVAPIVELALDGKLQAGAAVLLTGRNTGMTRSEAKAAARGATDNGNNASQQGTAAQGAGNTAAGNNGARGASGSTPQASSGEGPVTVAAAIAIHHLGGQSTARVGDNAQITTSGLLSLKNETDLDAQSDASGIASKGSTNVGAAVAINVAEVGSSARVGGGATGSVSSQGLALGATTVSGQRSDATTSATSGAASGNTGVAGSLAIGVGISRFEATLSPAAKVNAHSGAVMLDADSTTGDTVKALPDGGGAVAENTGVGASVAINVADHLSRAEIENGAKLTPAGSVTLNAKTDSAIANTAEGGAKGGTAVAPVVAVTVANQDAVARIGTGDLLDASGAIAVNATLASTNTTKAEGKAEGTKDAAIGAAVSVNVENDKSLASTARSLKSTGAIGVSATSSAASTAAAKASAVGGKEDSNAASDDKAVDDQNAAARNSGNS
ncbi:MAG: S-layer family protein, partial [Rubrivivax sp.]